MKKILISFLIVVGVIGTASSHAFALQQTTGRGVFTVPSTVIAASPYQVDLSALPDPAANSSKLQTILDLVFAVTGALSLLMVTIGGFRYIASQGDPQAAARAKGTITFALVGLIVSISAVGIVTFVINRT